MNKILGSKASSLAFHLDGNYLAVRLTNGILLIHDSKIKKLNYGTYREKFDLPKLDIVIDSNESKGAIISVRFFARDDILAVRFDNEKLPAAGELRSIKFDVSFTQLYSNRHSSKALN